MEREEVNKNENEINVDKTLRRGDIRFITKTVKINEKERTDLKSEENQLHLLTLHYVDENGEEQEFIIGNLDQIQGNGLEILWKDVKTIQKYVNQANLANQTEAYVNNRLNDVLKFAKEIFEEKYHLKYTPEGYDFFYPQDKEESLDEQYKFHAEKSVGIPENSKSNLVLYGDANVGDLFQNKEYFEKKRIEESSIKENLSNSVQTAEEQAKNRYEKNKQERMKLIQAIIKKLYYAEEKVEVTNFASSNMPVFIDIMQNILMANKTGQTVVEKVKTKSEEELRLQAISVVHAALGYLGNNLESYWDKVQIPEKYLSQDLQEKKEEGPSK